MKIKSQSNGINISAFINTNELEKSLIAPYKERVKYLESIVKKRDYYIKNMHFQLKKRKWIIYLGYISSELMAPLPKKLNMRRMMILFYMYERNYTITTKLKNDFLELGIPNSKIAFDINYMVSIGLIFKDKRGFYYLSNKGREIVEYYEKNMVKIFLHMAKIKQDISQMKNANDSLKKPTKYTEEELKERRLKYVKLMRPFWDSGYKIIPKDKSKRAKILATWIKKHGVEDEWYKKLAFDWSSK